MTISLLSRVLRHPIPQTALSRVSAETLGRLKNMQSLQEQAKPSGCSWRDQIVQFNSLGPEKESK